MKYYVWISTSTATATITTTHTQKNTVYFNPFKLIVHTCSILSRAELKESIFSRELLSTAPIASSNWGSQEAQVEHNKAVDHTSTCTTDRIEEESKVKKEKKLIAQIYSRPHLSEREKPK